MVFINKSKSKKSDKVEIIKNVNLFPLFMFSFFCLLMYILVMYRLNPNILFGITRNVKINSLATLFLFLSSSSLIIWLYNLIQFLINKQKIRLYTYVSALIYNIPGILISGRDALIIFILSSLIVIIYSLVYIKNNEKLNYNIKRKMRKLLLISFLLIMLYLLFVSNTRYGSNSSDVVDMFKWASGNAVFPDYLLNIYYSTGIIGKLLLNIVFYYTSQFSKFALAYNNFNGPYMHGLHQLHYLARALPSSFGINPNTTSIAVTNMCSNMNVYGMRVLWDTSIGYSIYDFGKVGALIYSFVVGFFVGKFYVSNKNNLNELNIITMAMICVGMFITIEISPIFDYFYIFPFIWLIIIRIIYYKKSSN